METYAWSLWPIQYIPAPVPFFACHCHLPPSDTHDNNGGDDDDDADDNDDGHDNDDNHNCLLPSFSAIHVSLDPVLFCCMQQSPSSNVHIQAGFIAGQNINIIIVE